MLILLSPAKRLDFSPVPGAPSATEPRLLDETRRLATTTRRLSAAEIGRLMSLSDDLARLNRQRFQALDPDSGEGMPAALAFAGDVYQGLDARSLSAEDLAWAQDRVRILSGLYGVLRPLDRIQPYRLEMGTRLRTRRGATLYDFWGNRIARLLTEDAEGHADPTVVNLASQEYFGAVDARALKRPLVNVRFEEEKDGFRRVVSFHAKKARGMMARWAVLNRAERAEDLKGFDSAGYRFDPAASGERDWVFARPQP